jgi:hypothetical protein
VNTPGTKRLKHHRSNILAIHGTTNPQVQAVLVGRDCSPILLGFGFGHNTVAQAQRDNVQASQPFEGFQRGTIPITKIRVISLQEATLFGNAVWR